MIDYKLLEALATVVEQGGFERAVSRLGLSQSAVSPPPEPNHQHAWFFK